MIRNNVRNTYSYFIGKHEIILHIMLCLHIELLADSSFFKCLITIKCSESRVPRLQISSSSSKPRQEILRNLRRSAFSLVISLNFD